MMCALQAKNTTFGLVMRGAAYRLQQFTMSDSPALERKFSMVDESIGNSQWLARLWEWTSQNGIRLHCADLLLPERAPTTRLVDSISGKCNKKIMRRGCLEFNVLTKFDLLQADGITICANMRSGGIWETTDPEWTALIRTHLGWQAEDSTAPFAVTMPNVTATPGTLVKFRDSTGEQRIGIVRTATHRPRSPALPNRTTTTYTILAANAATTNNTRSCKQMAGVLQPTTKPHEWHHREQAIMLSRDYPTMNKKDIRSHTNTRWRNLTDNNKTSYLKQQTDDGAAKARIFANNKLTHERRKCTQYIFNSNTLYDACVLQPLDSVSTPTDNNTRACALETHGTAFTAATNSDDQFISRPLPTSPSHNQPIPNNEEHAATHTNSTACVDNLIGLGRGQRNFVVDQRFG